MGNAFLSNISAADGIFHVVRVFDDEEVAHFEGDIDPVRDLDIISSELRIKDQATAAKNYENIKKVLVKNTAKENLIEKDVAEKCIELLANEKKYQRWKLE
jgi:obg-like ATPase 1